MNRIFHKAKNPSVKPVGFSLLLFFQVNEVDGFDCSHLDQILFVMHLL